MGFIFDIDGTRRELTIVARRPHLVLAIDGRRYVVEAAGAEGDGAARILIDGRERDLVRAATPDGAFVRIEGRSFEIRRIGAGAEAGGAGGGQDVIRAPMPGLVVSLRKAEGDRVRRGETILTIESMKLQMNLDAPRDGEIAELGIREGEGFQKDAILVRLTPPPAEG